MSAVPHADCRTVEHILSTIRALADGFNANGTETVKALDVKALEEQATVISTILESLQRAYPEVDSAQIKHIPAEWNTWLTASACARPSSLPGHKSGRRAPQAVPGSHSVWWLDKRIGAKVQLESYIQPSDVRSASMGVRRAVDLQQQDDGAADCCDTVLAVSQHAVAHLRQTTSHICLDRFLSVTASPQLTPSTLKLSMGCSVEMPVFRSTEPSDNDEFAANPDSQRQMSSSQHLCEDLPAGEPAARNVSTPKQSAHEGVLQDATNAPNASPKRHIPLDSAPQAKKIRPGTNQEGELHPKAAAKCKGSSVSLPVWREELSPSADKNRARLNRVNALAVSTLQVKGQSTPYIIVCAGGTLALPTTLAEDVTAHAAEPTTEQFASAMVWMVPMSAAMESKGVAIASEATAAPEGVPATCLLVSNDRGSLAADIGGSECTGVQSVSVQPVREGVIPIHIQHSGTAICCTANASGTVHVWLLHFQHAGLDVAAAQCSQCEMLRALKPLSRDSAPLTINSFCGLRQSARVARWHDEYNRTCIQLQVDSNDDTNTCEGCSEFGGCCSCRACGGLGSSLPVHKRRPLLEDSDEVFKIRHELEHEILFKEFGNTTAVAMSGKFLFAGSDNGAVAVWECGAGGAVQRVAGWWLEGESVSVLVPARTGDEIFVLVGMHCGKMYSFDTAGQLR